MANTKKCFICGKKLGFWSQYTNLKDGYLCGDCWQKYGIILHANQRNMMEWLETITCDQCRELINNPKKLEQAKIDHGYSKHMFESIDEAKQKEKQLLANSKVKDAKIKKEQEEEQEAESKYEKMLPIFKQEKSAQFTHFIFDDKRQQILQKKTLLTGPRFINYSDILSYRVNEQGHNANKHHGITRALIGGALAGSVGAIIGATTGMKQTDYIDHLGLIVNLKDGTSFEVVEIRRIDQVKSGSFSARVSIDQINQLIAKLDAIIAKNKAATQKDVANGQNEKLDPADEILKYKKLVDQHIITEEEFEKKKKQLLNL